MMKLTIQKIIPLIDILGASGISLLDSHIYIVGDNSPYLYKLNKKFKILERIPIYPTNDFNNNIISKPLKPDFEAIELINGNELIIFGSGSKSPERNVLKRVFLNNKNQVKTYDITQFYEYLKSLDTMKSSYLNIEAVAYFDNILYLFNRKKPVIFSFNYSEFIDYLEFKGKKPGVKSVEVVLPKIHDIEAGFSGATISLNTSQLLFTASVENTPNAYDDGDVLGSFLGIVDLKQLADSDAYHFIAIESKEARFKVESVTILNDDLDSSYELLFVTDSDGNETFAIKAKLVFG